MTYGEVFLCIVLYVIFESVIIVYAGSHFITYLTIHVPVWYKKWIKGECRHFCVLCNHFDVCEYGVEIQSYDYQRGFNEGYEYGYKDGTREVENITVGYEKGYHDGREDAILEIIDKMKHECK